MRGSRVSRQGTRLLSILLLSLFARTLPFAAQTTKPSNAGSEADRLRGEYGPYRANNDLLYYHLDSDHFDVATELYYVNVRKS